jgi:integrase/recombinase XerD
LDPENPLHGGLLTYCVGALAEGRAAETIRTQRRTLRRFIAWAEARGVRDPAAISRQLLVEYQQHLYLHVKRDGGRLAVASQVVSLSAIKAWLKWLVRQGRLQSNPAEWLRVPRLPSTLPATILSVAKVENIVGLADTASPIGVRDRAILETLYSAGIRRMELVNLSVAEADHVEGVLIVRRGKGGKDRLVPLGERASEWIRRYLAQVRPALATAESGDALFVDELGRPLSARYLGDLVRRYLENGGVTTRGACHVFRHAMATHMLDNGADIRHIQAMLGHARLETTQIYTRVSIAKLKQVHAATHPAARNRQPAPEPPALQGEKAG